jgi:hypothetical protein
MVKNGLKRRLRARYAFGESRISEIEIGVISGRALHYRCLQKRSNEKETTMSQASNIKATTTADALAKRLAAIAKLCATLGTQYQGLRQYRGL